jgi:hypothetical protein
VIHQKPVAAAEEAEKDLENALSMYLGVQGEEGD